MAGFRLGMRKERSWDIAIKRFEDAASKVETRIGIAIRRAALFAERELKKGIRAGAPGGKVFKPLSPITIALRRAKSSKPLMDSGSLLGSITTTFDKKNLTAFVGVHRTARSGRFNDQVNLAIIHEFGTKPFAIKVTPAIRKLFLYLSKITNGRIQPLSNRKTIINHPGVPARPFIRPTMEAIAPKIAAGVEASFSKGGPF